MSALGQKQTFTPLLDIIDREWGVLKFVEHHRETSPPKIAASGSRCCDAPKPIFRRFG
jgi:hypothetical protein